MLPTITVDGRLVADPELRFTPAGKAVCNVRVAASDSKKDEQGNWQTTEQIFVNATLWEGDGEQAAEHLRKGDPVLVTGRIYQREYEASDGSKRTSLEVKFATVARTIKARKAERSTSSTPASSSADPWATPAGAGEPPF